MKIVKLLSLMCLVLLTSCDTMNRVVGPPLPRKYAREFLQSQGYPTPLIEQVVNNGKLSEAEFYQFSNSQSEDVRCLVAGNPYTPIPLLTKLADDSETLVRQGVAHNISINNDIIDLLKNDVSTVQCSLVRNPSVPSEIILEIYKTKKVPLVFFADNPNCPEIIKQDIYNSWDSSAKQALSNVEDQKKAGVYILDKDKRWYRQQK